MLSKTDGLSWLIGLYCTVTCTCAAKENRQDGEAEKQTEVTSRCNVACRTFVCNMGLRNVAVYIDNSKSWRSPQKSSTLLSPTRLISARLWSRLGLGRPYCCKSLCKLRPLARSPQSAVPIYICHYPSSAFASSPNFDDSCFINF